MNQFDNEFTQEMKDIFEGNIIIRKGDRLLFNIDGESFHLKWVGHGETPTSYGKRAIWYFEREMIPK